MEKFKVDKELNTRIESIEIAERLMKISEKNGDFIDNINLEHYKKLYDEIESFINKLRCDIFYGINSEVSDEDYW